MVSAPKLHNAAGGIVCLDFVNSLDRMSDRPLETWPDALASYGDLLTWSVEAGTLTARRARGLRATADEAPRRATAILRRALALREAIYALYRGVAIDGSTDASALELINTELGKALAHARVARESGGFAWAWTEEPGAIDAPLWPIAGSAAELLVSPERELVRECAADGCLWLFLDRTKNHRRRWCDMKICGNRAKVREHRRRQRAHRDDGA